LPAPAPVLVALSGVGKSTLASQVATEIAAGALVIDGDDFYRGGDDAYWDALGPAEKVDLVIDWRRQRTLLEYLRRGEPATWQPYDWDADDGRLAAEITVGPAGVVILDGAYAALPEPADSSACGRCWTFPATSGGRASCSGTGRTTGQSVGGPLE
jgi:uridine kinase